MQYSSDSSSLSSFRVHIASAVLFHTEKKKQIIIYTLNLIYILFLKMLLTEDGDTASKSKRNG